MGLAKVGGETGSTPPFDPFLSVGAAPIVQMSVIVALGRILALAYVALPLFVSACLLLEGL